MRLSWLNDSDELSEPKKSEYSVDASLSHPVSGPSWVSCRKTRHARYPAPLKDLAVLLRQVLEVLRVPDGREHPREAICATCRGTQSPWHRTSRKQTHLA